MPTAISSKGNSDPEWLQPFGNDLLMSATDGYTGRGLWHLDGTTLAPTALTSGNPSRAAVLSSGVGVFTAGGSFTFGGLWRTDGTPVGTLQLDLDVAFPCFETRTEPFLWMDRPRLVRREHGRRRLRALVLGRHADRDTTRVRSPERN